MGPISPFEIPGMAGTLQRGTPMEVPTTKGGGLKKNTQWQYICWICYMFAGVSCT